MPVLLSTLQNSILILTLNRPERANALNAELIAELQKALRGAAKDPGIRAIVITGAGHVFSAGQDIEEMRAGGEDLSYLEHQRKSYNPLVLQIRQIEKPELIRDKSHHDDDDNRQKETLPGFPLFLAAV